MHHTNKTNRATQPQTITIYADTFQPFSSRQGIDEVVRLQFEYCPMLVARPKALLAVYAVGHRYRVVGGWLPDQRCWFCECDVWEIVRLELLYLGYAIMEAKP